MYNKRFCKEPERIENYEKAKADNFVGWEIHHRLETHTSDGERRLIDITYKELIALDMYYNRPPEELIFLTTKEHNSFKKGKKHSEETRKKMSEAHKNVSDETRQKLSEANTGEKNPFYGKHHSEETKKKIGEKSKGRQTMLGKHHTEESKKKMSEVAKNMSKEHKMKIAVAQKGRHWYNNGVENKFCYECPDGFVKGKLQK